MTPGRIAVVVACRDLGDLLLEAIDSVDRQTRPPHEIVVVDDRSSDGATREILANLREDGTCVLEGPGRGASAARNLGASVVSADYLVFLDGDDILEPAYFADAAARLDRDPKLDFVSSAMRHFGEANFVWKPAAPSFVDAIATGGVPHASTVMRRRVWETVGGFDESIASFELLDFWAEALERGFLGVVLDEAYIRYRVRADSGYRRSIQQETYLSRMRHFYAKHRRAVERHGRELLAAKEAFFISQRNYWQGLETRAAALERELAQIEQQTCVVASRLSSIVSQRSPVVSRPATGDRQTGDWRPATGDYRPSRGIILAYHRVADLAPDSHGLCTPPDVFRAHMMFVRDHMTPMSLMDLADAAAAASIPDGAVAVTLDDGYLDAMTAASPILTETGVPATFFVNSDRLADPHERWFDVLERLFAGGGALPPALSIEAGGGRLLLATASPPERAAALESLNRQLWPMDARARSAILDAVLAWAGAAPDARSSHRVMTADELRTLALRAGHTIGAHTTHHLALTTQPLETKRREIVDDKAAIERVVERPVRLFSYPYGDFDADTIGLVREAGFRAAVTIDDGAVAAGTNRLMLPRYEIGRDRQRDFASLMRTLGVACAV